MMRLETSKRQTEPENPENVKSMVLLAAAWLTSEYCELVKSPENALEHLSQMSTAKLDPAIQQLSSSYPTAIQQLPSQTYLQSLLKIFAFRMNSLQESWNEEARQSPVEKPIPFMKASKIYPVAARSGSPGEGIEHLGYSGYHCGAGVKDSSQDWELHVVRSYTAQAAVVAWIDILSSFIRSLTPLLSRYRKGSRV
ncbi:hypothetical protein B0O80DRAFT_231563 [Mortierella sp. GBAus27b]|nr:hypothetical protein B0O80DRAFT_231563 [Mortierella sp. GBAus27b]